MPKLIRLVATSLVLVVVSACSSMMGGELIRPGEPVGTLEVVNASRGTISVVTVSTCSALSHGFNRLPSGVNLSPGQSHQFTVSAGCYDVQAGWSVSGGDVYAEIASFGDIEVPAGRTYSLTVTAD